MTAYKIVVVVDDLPSKFNDMEEKAVADLLCSLAVKSLETENIKCNYAYCETVDE